MFLLQVSVIKDSNAFAIASWCRSFFDFKVHLSQLDYLGHHNMASNSSAHMQPPAGPSALHDGPPVAGSAAAAMPTDAMRLYTSMSPKTYGTFLDSLKHGFEPLCPFSGAKDVIFVQTQAPPVFLCFISFISS